MKYIIIIPDGIGGHPLETLGGKTTLEVARIPNLNYFAKMGKVGTVRTVSDKPFPHAAFATLLGYEFKQNLMGPGPFEAANLEVKLEENEIAFQMNFVTESEGVLADPTAGHVTSKESKALIGFLNKKLSSEFVRFFAGGAHRHIVVIKDARGYKALSAECMDPESIVGKPIQNHFPKGPGEDMLKKLMFDAKSLLENHEINQVRIDLGENPANMIWLYGQGCMPNLPKFSTRFNGMTGASISTQEAVKGFSRLIGLTVVELGSAHAFPDFDYEGHADKMLELAKEKDFVVIHLRACSEAAKSGDLKQKVLSLEALDHHVIGAAKAFYEAEKDVRFLIAPLMNLPVQTRTYSKDSVPFILAGKNVMPDEIELFSEATAQLSNLKFKDGSKLMDLLVTGKDLS